MIVPQSNNTNGASISIRTKLSNPESNSDNNHVRVPTVEMADIASTTTALPDSDEGAACSRSRSIGEHDLSQTSPLTSERPRDSAMGTPIQEKPDAAQYEGVQISLPLRQLAPKPASLAGGARNPIVINDSPPPKSRQVLKQKDRQQPEPHQFVGRGYENLYSSQPSRPALATKPANGSTFTGHLNEDMYRMMNAKSGATPTWNMNGNSFLNTPFEVLYPASAQFLKDGGALRVPFPFGQYDGRQPPASGHHMVPIQDKKMFPPIEYPKLPSENEEQLRSRVVQYVHELYQPKQRKRRLSEIDPNETSLSESEQPMCIPKTSPIKRVSRPATTTAASPLVNTNTRPLPTRKLTVYRDDDHNFELNQFTDHTELLTSLLKLYPHSKDQKGLCKDISMLMLAVNHRWTTWEKSEREAPRKRQKMVTESHNHMPIRSGQNKLAAAALKAQQEKERKAKMDQDNEMRGLLSAGANLWQDGSGEGVADVFATEPGMSTGEDMEGIVDSLEVKTEDD